MELTQLKQFVAVAESGSLSLAAERLYISQPALSTMLKKLESELGVELFQRTRNKITLNEAGELALQHAQQILAQAERMKTELREFARRDQIFKVGFCDPGPMWLAVPKFAMMFPDLELQPSRYDEESQALEQLRSGQLDLLLSAKPNAERDLACQFLCRDQLLLSVMKNTISPVPESLFLREAPVRELALFQAEGAFLRQNRGIVNELPNVQVKWFKNFFLLQQHLSDTQAATFNTQIVQNYRKDSGERDLIPLSDPEAMIDYYLIYQEKNQERLKPLLQWLTGSFEYTEIEKR
ncbi:LysR family transcriptional regulator [Aggregatibacter actinomycetemcomitans]|nr:LysR family transcriptional regulator [Aggregatibacter actinomycetemcomitans]